MDKKKSKVLIDTGILINLFDKNKKHFQLLKMPVTVFLTEMRSFGLFLAEAFIASIALFFDIELFTFNKKDFQFIKDLKLHEP